MSQIRTLIILILFVLVNTACSDLKRSDFFVSSKKIKVNAEDFKRTVNTSEGATSLQSADPMDITITDELVVVADNECLKNRDLSKASTLSQDIIATAQEGQALNAKIFNARVPASTTVSDLEQLADSDECIESVSINGQRKVTALPNDPQISLQTHLTTIHFEEGYTFFQAANITEDIIIAVIDDGINLNHAEIRDQLWENTREKNGTAGVDDDQNGYVDDIHGYNFIDDNANISSADPAAPHGTHVAGLIAAQTNNARGVAGVYSKAKIMVLKVCGEEFCDDEAVLEAIQYATNNGAKIANMSLGGSSPNSLYAETIRRGVSNGTTYFAAAGNGIRIGNESVGYELSATGVNEYPAGYAKDIPGFISVAAVDTNTGGDGLCNFSNFSATFVELAAPGCDTNRPNHGIVSTWSTVNGQDNLAAASGTSMASPIAAAFGAAISAYAKKQNQEYSPAQVEDFLKRNSRTVASLQSKIQGGKTVDMTTLVEALRNFTTTTPPAEPVKIEFYDLNGRTLASTPIGEPSVPTIVLNYDIDEFRPKILNASQNLISCATMDADLATHPSQNIEACQNLPKAQWSILANNTEWSFANGTWSYIGTPLSSNGSGPRTFRLLNHPYIVKGKGRMHVYDPNTQLEVAVINFKIQ